MSQQDKPPAPRLLRLLSDLTDGGLEPAAQEELTELLRRDRRSLEFYYEWMTTHALLHLDLNQGGVDILALQRAAEPGLKPRPLDRRAAWRLAVLSAAPGVLAAGLLLAIIGRGDFSAQDVNAIARFEREQALKRFRTHAEEAVAVLSEASAPVWAGADRPQVGAALPAGRLSLAAGVVQLEFVSGSIVVIEGPAEVDLISSMRIDCQKGRLRARVPAHAQGFTIDTPTQRAIDLGTEFAVNVTDQDVTEIHVLDGEVEVRPLARRESPAPPQAATDASARTRLTVGMGLRSVGDQAPTSIPANGDAFVGAQELLELTRRESSTRHAEWLEARRRLEANQNVILYYSFEGHQEWERVLHNDGPVRKNSLDGAIVGGRWTEGRWPWKHALEFKRTSDRVRTEVPDEFQSITLACWVRIDGFDRPLSALFMTEGHEHGEVHWQFTETGRLLLGVKAEPELSHEYLSPSALRIADVGRWVHLACVYDRQAGEVIHYRDGRVAGRHEITKHVTLRFGRAELGNWQPAEWSTTDLVRGLNGRMDEFALFDKPLTHAEVKALYNAGRI